MKYTVEQTSRFKKELQKIIKQGKSRDKLLAVVKLLAEGNPLPPQYKGHALVGDMLGYRDCHIENDWLLLYTVKEDILVLALTRTGTHADLF